MEEIMDIICLYYKGTLTELEKCIVTVAQRRGYTGTIKDLEKIRKDNKYDF